MHSKRYLWFPIKFIWANNKKITFKYDWFNTHGIQEGWDGAGMGVFSRIIHLGRLKVKLGNPNFKKKPHKQKHIPIEDR